MHGISEERIFVAEQSRGETHELCKKMKKNKTLEKIAEDLEEEISVIEPLYRVAEKFAPDYDSDAVFKQIVSNREK